MSSGIEVHSLSLFSWLDELNLRTRSDPSVKKLDILLTNL